MSYVYQCSRCTPMCLLVANDDGMPISCPFVNDAQESAEWRQIQ